MVGVDQVLEKLSTVIDGSINLAKELLANGDVPSAQAQLDLANEIIDGLYGEITGESADINDVQLKAFADNTIADLESMIDAATNLHLSKFVIANLQETLDTLKSGDNNEILEITSEGGNLDLAVLVLPKQVVAGDNLSGQGLGVGEIPPGIEKKIDGDGATNDKEPKVLKDKEPKDLGDVPPGFETKIAEENLPSGFQKKLDAILGVGGDLPLGFEKKIDGDDLSGLPKGFLKKLQGIDDFGEILDPTAFSPDDIWADISEQDFKKLFSGEDDKKDKKDKKVKKSKKSKTVKTEKKEKKEKKDK